MSMKLTKKAIEPRKGVEMRSMKKGDIGLLEKSDRYVMRIGASLNSVWLILDDHLNCDYYDYIAAQYHHVQLLTKEEVLTIEFRGSK